MSTQAAAQVLALQQLDARASTPGGQDEADEVDKQSGKDELLSVAMLSVAKAHFHALKSCDAEVQEEAYHACQLAEESRKAARQHAADQHFSFWECVEKDETHELMLRPEWYTRTTRPGVAWCDLNHISPHHVLLGSRTSRRNIHGPCIICTAVWHRSGPW